MLSDSPTALGGIIGCCPPQAFKHRAGLFYQASSPGLSIFKRSRFGSSTDQLRPLVLLIVRSRPRVIAKQSRLAASQQSAFSARARGSSLVLGVGATDNKQSRPKIARMIQPYVGLATSSRS